MELFLHHIERMVLFLAEYVPLELFVFVGSLIEEVVAPIPSMLIMTTAGFLAVLDGHTPFFLLWLVSIGNLGKALGSLGWYVIGDKLEDVVIGKFGRFFGLSHGDIERIGNRFTGSEWRDGAVIFILRCIPFFPSLALSLACGVIKIKLRTFLLASYLGNFCKDIFYIFAGYYGARTLKTFFVEIERIRFGLGILIGATVAIALILAYRERHRGTRLLSRFYVWVKQKLG